MKPFENKYEQAAETDRINNLGVAEYQNRNIEMAMSYFKQALNVMPQNDDALINLGICYCEMKKYDEAIKLYQKAIQIHPDRDAGYKEMGIIFYQKSDMPNAIKWWKEAAKRGNETAIDWLKTNGYI